MKPSNKDFNLYVLVPIGKKSEHLLKFYAHFIGEIDPKALIVKQCPYNNCVKSFTTLLKNPWLMTDKKINIVLIAPFVSISSDTTWAHFRQNDVFPHSNKQMLILDLFSNRDSEKILSWSNDPDKFKRRITIVGNCFEERTKLLYQFKSLNLSLTFHEGFGMVRRPPTDEGNIVPVNIKKENRCGFCHKQLSNFGEYRHSRTCEYNYAVSDQLVSYPSIVMFPSELVIILIALGPKSLQMAKLFGSCFALLKQKTMFVTFCVKDVNNLNQEIASLFETALYRQRHETKDKPTHAFVFDFDQVFKPNQQIVMPVNYTTYLIQSPFTLWDQFENKPRSTLFLFDRSIKSLFAINWLLDSKNCGYVTRNIFTPRFYRPIRDLLDRLIQHHKANDFKELRTGDVWLKKRTMKILLDSLGYLNDDEEFDTLPPKQTIIDLLSQ
jgi:hypothetical protein